MSDTVMTLIPVSMLLAAYLLPSLVAASRFSWLWRSREARSQTLTFARR
jgi:hypothetical protein